MTDEYPHYLEFRHIYKTFDKPVLVDANFFVDGGETVAIIGRSGVGKSVTLGHMMGFLKPDKGRVIVAHEDVTDFTEEGWRRARRKITMVFQSGALFDSLTVKENVLFSLELREDYDEQNKEDVVEGLLKMVDIWDARDAYPADLSTGYRRAVAIARAMSGATPSGSPDGLLPVTSRKLLRLMPARRTPVGASSALAWEDAGSGMGVHPEKGEG